ncbi:hypothetical protein M758_7G012200 [Ceratodon purpureus]|uniref:Enoyl reductase (ER) domain-containing protein n=1 Tax=Ceratodon purpureus TaxID=3225 RepID=A0A8T0H0W9_CERPU|nr:hypothetical protein KC19_7G012000 [Ceratodon purpureus]KAG0609763.1 hypothetical protein M758_7G012200 [Ceratodon purpureus]KAG0609764.1 hypothetical protein M758_7G012200 [Ceratodon purpureus]KAG0609765.1 hypothetical protein M758_7G012200 [Ceratodon purpureus]KAG0609766.1 hypothetical protein M758_7G012200 [Ceratodon purpureus]
MATSVLDVPATMKAVSYSAYGGGAEGLQHVELPVPKPRKDEVLVKVEACSINPIDWKVQKGFMKPVLPYKFPHVPGADIAGMVISVGPGVTTFVPGDKVVSCLGRAGGGLAEYAIAPTSTTIKRRHEVTPIYGSAMGISGFTALQSVRNSANIDIEGRSKETKNLLIRAASGGVGTLAVQIAKLGGAHVTVTCSPQNFELLKSLGADEVLDCNVPDEAAPESPSGKKYDVIINCGPHRPFPQYKSQLAHSGFVIDLNPSPKGFMTTALNALSLSKQKYFPFMHIPNSVDMYLLFNLLHLKKIKLVIDSTYPLAKAQEAWARCMEGHAVGKIVISICEPLQSIPHVSSPIPSPRSSLPRT